MFFLHYEMDINIDNHPTNHTKNKQNHGWNIIADIALIVLVWG